MEIISRSRIGREGERKNKSWREKMKMKMKKGGDGDRLGKKYRSSLHLLEEDSSSVEEIEKSPCILGGYGASGEGPLVYLFELEDDDEKRQGGGGGGKRRKHRRRGEEQPGMRVLTPMESTCKPKGTMLTVAVGTTVYALGGAFPDPEKGGEFLLSDKVFCLDTSRLPHERWRRGPDMCTGRCRGIAVAVKGKIYVFGGFDYKERDDRRPWAEVFDPMTDKWEPLPRPPPQRPFFYAVSPDVLDSPFAVYGGDKIFLDWCELVYHVDSKTWKQYSSIGHPHGSCSNNLTAVGNTLYWSSNVMRFLHSVDMETNVYHRTAVKGIGRSEYADDGYLEPALLPLGGDTFCFLTLPPGLPRPGHPTDIGFSKFRVVSHRDGFKASVVCRRAYTINHPLAREDAFILDKKLVGNKKVKRECI